MNAEEVKVGCFQMVLVLLLGINYVIVAMSHALPVFHNYTPRFYCQSKNSTIRSYGCQAIANSSIGSSAFSPELSTVTLCSGEYHFVTEFEESSVVTEWSLVCEKQYLSFLGPTVYYIGVLIGAWIAGLLADRFGRLPVQAICLYAQGTMAVALYIVQSYPAFLTLRSLQGIFVQGLQNSTYILSLELFPVRLRTLVALIMQISWSIGLVLLAALSYLIPDWRILQLAISVPTAITVLYIWIIPESPRWLLARGKSTEADMALETITKYNGCCVRLQKESIPTQDTYAKSNIMPVKPERKSRVTSADLKKANSHKDKREEARNLLMESQKTTQQQIIRRSSRDTSTNSEQQFCNVELRRDVQYPVENSGKKDLPSSSRCEKKANINSQIICEPKVLPKTEEEVVLRRIKKKQISENERKMGNGSKRQSMSKTSLILKNVFKSATLKKYIVIMIYQWLTSAMACSIFDEFTPNFPINRHITFALGGTLEIATYTITYFVVSIYGRRLSMCIYQTFNGTICILIAAFLTLITPTAPWIDLVKTVMSLFGRMAVANSIFIIYLYTVEIFPTVIRGSCLGLCVVFAKIGNLSTLHLLLWKQYIPILVPLLTIGMLCLISGALALILPETMIKILPDRVMDIETINNSNQNADANTKIDTKEDLRERQILRKKLFSEIWVDAGNGILVNFSENKNAE